MALKVFAVILLVTAVATEIKQLTFSDDFINAINKDQSLWKAGRNFPLNISMSYLRHLTGNRRENVSEKLPAKQFHLAHLKDIPENFDARDKWPECPSIGHIRDQSECGSCWAVSTTSAMTDRICIQSGGNITTPVSAADLMSCIPDTGCDGGWISEAWLHWVNKGIASGGDYGTTDGCVNYPFPPCNHGAFATTRPRCTGDKQTPACAQTCDSSTRPRKDELTFGKSSYYLKTEDDIQQEILTNGPVTADYDVYEDFFLYQKGIYFQQSGRELFSHAVKVIGWGVENSTAYWLAVNSWNEDWGDKGVFKIRRGTNECDFEKGMTAGQPKLS